MTYSGKIVSYWGLENRIAMGSVRQQVVQVASREYGEGNCARNPVDANSRCTSYRNAVRIFLTDALGLGLALLERVFVLELASHGHQYCCDYERMCW